MEPPAFYWDKTCALPVIYSLTQMGADDKLNP